MLELINSNKTQVFNNYLSKHTENGISWWTLEKKALLWSHNNIIIIMIIIAPIQNDETQKTI